MGPAAPGSHWPSSNRWRFGAVALIALVAALFVAACGSSSSTSSSSTPASSGASSTPASNAQPGKGKPTLTLGTKDFTEEFILGQLYKQALEHAGYKINYKENIGATEVIDKALTSGKIDAYPEYTGESAVTVAGVNKTVKSPQEEYNIAKQFYTKRGQTMSQMTPFFDTDAIATTKAFATKNGLTTMSDLKKVKHFTLGARPEFADREQGAAGMKKDYGLNNFTFKSLALGIQYQALDSGKVDSADVFTTDPQLASGKYTVLKDPKNIFGFQNIALVINTKKLQALGGDQFMAIINKVNSLLTTPAVISMNKAVAINKQSAATVAKSFLQANNLI
ncbi:MAG TPA: glycine betaine ABC transporter substrate-binding protein [Thermoleophilaceae bacterium]